MTLGAFEARRRRSDAPLSPQEERAIYLDRRGLSWSEIADDLVITDDHLDKLFRRAEAKGYEVPPRPPKKTPTGVPTVDMVALRNKLRASGITKTNDINTVIAERYGLDAATVRMRLIRHDRRMAARRSEAST